MTYHAQTAAIAAFLARASHAPFPEGEIRAEKRRAIFWWLGLIRTVTRQACGERGWTGACLLPLAFAMGVLLR